jgi:hypothetical protein
MSIVGLHLPPVKRQTEKRPQSCPNCYGETFQRWGRIHKQMRDKRFRSVQAYRYRCRRSFRHYPEGVDKADQTQRMGKLAAIYWIMGLSLRSGDRPGAVRHPPQPHDRLAGLAGAGGTAA